MSMAEMVTAMASLVHTNAMVQTVNVKVANIEAATPMRSNAGTMTTVSPVMMYARLPIVVTGRQPRPR
ncbi:hypothetical protein [Mycobacterium sp. NPDC050853]|uniref:hypothetical protein n=1 Tax=Mycobacterium sp. NPDC050853 TaxID=3155160 RepID=UPI0033EC0299